MTFERLCRVFHLEISLGYNITLLIAAAAVLGSTLKKISEVAQGKHDPVRLAVAGGAVAFTTAAHYLVHSASEPHSDAERESKTQRNI